MVRPPYKCLPNRIAVEASANVSTYSNITHFNTSHEYLQIGTLDWISVSMNAVVFILATLGNILVITTLARKKMSSVTNCFLLSLAASDLMVALFCIPITTVGKLKADFIFGEPTCKIFGYLIHVSVAVSTFTMVAISLERYYAICQPLRARSWQTKSHALKVIITIWIISSLLMTPVLVYLKVVMIPIARLRWCNRACRLVFRTENASDFFLAPSDTEKAWYSLLLIVLLGLPGILMSVAYGCVCRTMYSGFAFPTKQGAETPDGNATPRIDRKSRLGNTANGHSIVQGQKRLNQTHCTAPSSKNPGKSLLTTNTSNQTDVHSDISRKTESTKQADERKKVVEMLIVIVILFFVCWTPNMVANLWKAVDPIAAGNTLRGIPINIIQMLGYFSCCINPIVYCFLNKRFRTAFIDVFSKCFICLPARLRPTPKTTRHTVTTQYSAVTTA